MVLLIGSKYDITSTVVKQWLVKFNSKFINLNTEDCTALNSLKVINKEERLIIKNIDLNEVNVVWHRRGRLRHIPVELNNLGEISRYLKKEEDALIKSIELSLQRSTLYIGSYLKEVENYKLYNLIIAKSSGFCIPNTLVTNQKKELIEFHNNTKGKIISKDIRYPVNIKNGNEYISSCGTFVVERKDIEILEDNFAPILVQEYIDKVFEIRVFYFQKRIYSMAIFSQNDSKTKIDFRNYNNEKPNRCVPFSLPKEIQKIIINFSDMIGLKTGSIDLIYNEKGEYVFLEVNPMGQLDWVSKNCNYYIEKQIAIDLIDYDNKHK